ncbi:MAG: hypothetical protein WB439_15555 [Acidobacteriaceae bacterium]
MLKRILLLCLCATASAYAQGPTTVGQLLQQTLDQSTLTHNGEPFHAILDISPQAVGDHPSPGPAYTGRVELWWSNPTTYRLALTSPAFTLQRTVANGSISETHTGDFYPRWLQTFVRALLDPVPPIFTSVAGAQLEPGRSFGGGFSTQTCIRRDDRTNGITNDLTWGILCFDRKSSKPAIDYIVTLNYFMQFSNRQPFDNRMIAYSYQTYVLDDLSVVGNLTTLEPLTPADAATLTVTTPTPPTDRIHTVLVSTQKEESLLDHAPTLHWPSVQEGKTDGYMIIYARTDRTGQVRESTTHNSDNPDLEDFGMQQALNYKFKPLLVDGAPVQMEMPLVLHFTSRIENAPPYLTPEQMKHQVRRCDPPPVPNGFLTKGQHAIVKLTITETGKVSELHPNSPALWGRFFPSDVVPLMNCTFHPYLVNGQPVRYEGDFKLPEQ